MKPFRLLPILVVLSGLLAAPAIASASTSEALSKNWAGYAVHRSGLTFRKISAAWTEPNGACSSGRPTYSAFWVGIGGYSYGSDALEQTGTEVNCRANGTLNLYAWYELVPAPSREIRAMTVKVGDSMTASVSISGHKVTIRIADLTRDESFHRTFHASHLDTSSAEWIAEAPSECTASGGDCVVLPLADFGSMAFSSARVETTRRYTGSIASRRWHTVRIFLGREVGDDSAQLEAEPSVLLDGGRAFGVTYESDPGSVENDFRGMTLPGDTVPSGRLQPGGVRLAAR